MNKKHVLLEIKRREIKNDFWKYLEYMDGDFWKMRALYLKPLSDKVTEYYLSNEPDDIYKFEEGGEKYYKMKINIALFPRFAKSFWSQRLKEWLIIIDNNIQILSLSANQTLSTKLHRKLLDTFKTNKRFRFLFNYKPLIANSQEFTITAGVTNCFATSIGGQSTGNGANVIIIDDAYKDHATALSDVQNQKVLDFYDSAIKNRFEGDKRLEIHIGTRWTTKELTAELIKQNHFHHIVKVPALQNGKSILPGIISTKELLTFMKNDPVTFDSTYQQNPNDVKGALFPRKELIFVDKFAKQEGSISFVSVDLADEGDDFASAPLAQKNKYTGNYCISDVCFTNENSEVFEIKLKKFIKKHRPTFLVIEKNSDPTLARIIVNYCYSVGVIPTKIHSTANKHKKILSNTGRIKKLEFLNNQNGIYHEAITQLTTYEKDGSSKHDDFADSLAMLIEHAVKYLPSEFEIIIEEEEYENHK